MRRILTLVSGLCAALLALYSCSMHAEIATDHQGRVVGLSSVRLESSLARIAVEMLVAGGELAVELRWLRGLSPASIADVRS